MIIGHSKVINLLGKEQEKENFSQAYLFCGPAKIGKFTIARMFAEALIKGIKLGAEEISEKPVPDLIVIQPEFEQKKNVRKEGKIKIEQIRQAQKEMANFPFRGKYKVAIIDKAERLTGESQNALLKTLEEPNSTSIIILVTEDPAKILATVQSRCRRVNFNLVKQEEIAQGLELKKIENADQVAALALGRPGLAVLISQDKKEWKWRQEAQQQLENLSRAGINERLKMAENFSRDVSQALERLEFWSGIIRQTNFQGKKKNYEEGLKTLSQIEEALTLLENTNVNARLVLENLILGLE